MINRAFFFEQCRDTLFTGRLTQSQVDGLNTILDVWEASHANQDDRWLAYALGTAFHETGFKMQPVIERGGPAYHFRMYDPGSPVPDRAKLARKMGAKPGDGVVFFGRGFVQLTWRTNYAKVGAHFGVDLTSSPAAANAALEPELSARILFHGMETGMFTGKKFAHYFNDDASDWRQARRIVNGMDCADAIALYARKFYASISYTKG